MPSQLFKLAEAGNDVLILLAQIINSASQKKSTSALDVVTVPLGLMEKAQKKLIECKDMVVDNDIIRNACKREF